MATIKPNSDERVFSIHEFLGLNQSPDGDTQLEYGEASEQINWMCTKEKHLKVRPGYLTLKQFNGPVRGLWSGYVAGREQMVCAADGGLWEPMDNRRIGDVEDLPVNFFAFGNRVYLLDGVEYMVWDGDGFATTVDGYIPLIQSATAPGGGGTLLENVNRLTGKRRLKFSPDGTATEFVLPEKDLLSIWKVEIGGKPSEIKWTPDLAKGTVKFESAPEKGQNTIQIWYTAPNNRRVEVDHMKFAEQFNGAADSRVFLYGDGSNKAVYSGVTEVGLPSAEYFPDLYELNIGSDNAPITGMSKNYNRLMSYKSDGGAYSTIYNTQRLVDGKIAPGFETVSVHREIGNDAPGQVRLVANYPRTIYQGNIYEWVYANYYSRDERNAKLISEKVQETMRAADPSKIYTFDDDALQEYYIFLNDAAGTVLVNNYQNKTWYMYTGLPVTCACRHKGDLYFGFSDGRLVRFAAEYTNDDGKPIDAYFATGNMSFDKDYKRKHSSQIWVSMKPTSHGNLIVTAQSDRRTDYLDKTIDQSLFGFSTADFSNWTFSNNEVAQMERLKLKIKKFVFYKLILRSNHETSDATVLGVDLRVRYTGFVK